MSENIEVLSLVHLLTKRKILTAEEAKDIHSITYLKQVLVDKNIFEGVDLERMEKRYEAIISLVRGYIAENDSSKRIDVLSNLETVLNEED